MSTSNAIEIITCGSELLDGRVLNTNQRLICQKLWENGRTVQRCTTVGDKLSDLCVAIQDALAHSNLVIITGGLGPTDDDRTREAVSKVFGRPLKEDRFAFEEITRFFGRKGQSMSPSNQKQALCPEGAACIPNPHGTAPGIQLTIAQKTIYCLPGVPSEMEPMLDAYVLPEIRSTTPPKLARFKCFGVGESYLQDQIQDIYPLADGMELAFQVAFPEVHLQLLAEQQLHQDLFSKAQLQIEHALKPHLFSTSESGLFETTLMLLKSRNFKWAVAESCTGGLLANLITAVPGSSDVFLGGVVSYSNAVKSHLLHVPSQILKKYDAVSAEAAQAMAEGVFKEFKADICTSITGIAGPSGGTADHPIGTVYIATRFPTGEIQIDAHQFPPVSRQKIRILSVFHAAYAVFKGI